MKRDQLSIRIRPDVHRGVKNMEEETGLSKSRVIEHMLSMLDTYFTTTQIKYDILASEQTLKNKLKKEKENC